MHILVTSASGANGNGYGAILGFGPEGEFTGPFGGDPRIADPRGMSLDPSGAFVYLNSGDDRVLALDLHGYVVRDSGRIPGLDPGGAEFGPDGRYYVTVRRQRTIRAMPAALDGEGEFLLPQGIVPFPRGFGFGQDGRLYLASGVAPSGQGDNTIVVFDRSGILRTPRLVTDPKLSPLDLKLAPNGNIVVASEWPFGAADAVPSVREYDSVTGQLVRVFAPERSVGFRRPRGLRFGPGDRLYCTGQDHVVAFDFRTGSFVGPVARLARLNGQALVLVPLCAFAAWLRAGVRLRRCRGVLVHRVAGAGQHHLGGAQPHGRVAHVMGHGLAASRDGLHAVLQVSVYVQRVAHLTLLVSRDRSRAGGARLR